MPTLNWNVLSDFSTRSCCGGVGTRCLEEILMISPQSWMGGARMPWASPSWPRRVWWFIGHLPITPLRRSHVWIHPLSIPICICLERSSTLLKNAAPGGKWMMNSLIPLSDLPKVHLQLLVPLEVHISSSGTYLHLQDPDLVAAHYPVSSFYSVPPSSFLFHFQPWTLFSFCLIPPIYCSCWSEDFKHPDWQVQLCLAAGSAQDLQICSVSWHWSGDKTLWLLSSPVNVGD